MTTRRILLSIVATILVILFTLLGIVIAVFNSERGTQWSLQLAHNYLPQLSSENISGDWLHGVHVDNLQWLDEKTELRISDINIRLHWPSLLHGEVQLTTLRARELRLESKGESNDFPVVLPRLFLPFTLSAPELTVRQLQIVNADSRVDFDDIGAAVRWRATTLRARDLKISWQNLHLHSSGSIGFQGDYPLRLRGELAMPQQPSPIALSTEGDLRQLIIHANSGQPYAVRSEIKLATLSPHLPLEIIAELTQPNAQPSAVGEIKINTAKIAAHGDLTRIDATLESSITEPHYGTTQINASAQWQPEQLQIDARWNLNPGDLQFHCSTSLPQPLQIKCDGAASTIALTPWLTDESGDISSTIKLEGSWSDTAWSLAMQLPDVRGKLNNTAISGQLDLVGADDGLWQLHKLDLAEGPNKLSAKGKFGSQNQLQVDINAGDLARLHPQLGGEFNTSMELDGTWPQPNLRGQWRGARLRYADTRIAHAVGEVSLSKAGIDNSRVQMTLEDIVSGNHSPVDLTVNVSGKRNQQQVTLNAHQSAHRINLRCTTNAAADFLIWQISCPDFSGEVQTESIHERWRNSEALSARLQLETVNANRGLAAAELKPFCLRAAGAELCLDQPLLYQRSKLQPTSAHGNALPLRWLNTLLPQDVQLQNDARATLHMQLQSVAPLRADASLDIPLTRWEWSTLTGEHSAEINAINVSAKLNEQRADVTASAHSPTLGDVNALLGIIDPRERRELDGHIALQRIQLAGFAWMVQGLDSISGEINGDIRVAGTAHAPQLHGQLLLKDGNAVWSPLGAPFHDVHADLTFDNNSAKLGGWFALGQGGGDIDGRMSWEGAGENWQLQLGLIAGGLSAMPLPNSTVIFSPHIEANAKPGEFHITGYVDIASAEITLKQLPPNTTDVSQDQRIVGEQADTGSSKLWADLGLNLGDKFHFAGFGADVNLSGKLKINKAPGDLLHVNGEVHVPRGRYRAYGQRLSVRKGSFIFYGPLDNPDLNLEAVRDMPPGVTDVVGLRVIGSLKTPEALLFSEPSLSDSDTAYYLLTGRKPTASTSSTTNQYSASGALLSLGMAGSEDKAGQLAEKFGIHDLQLGTGASSAGNSEAEISGQLGKGLYVRYGHELTQRSNSISFQYQLTPRLMIETINGIEDALDLLYSFEIK